MQLQDMTSDERLDWTEKARVDAILDSCRLSLKSVRSGVRCYEAYVGNVHPEVNRLYPPRLDLLMAWSTLFRSPGTWANYIGYVKTACLVAEVSAKVFEEPALQRAKASVEKRCNFVKRPKMFLQRCCT